MTSRGERQPKALDVIIALRRPKVAVMLGLGFSSGLPFLLTGNTLGYWLRDKGVTLTAIGFISWVGLAYSLKFLWAPLIDRLDAPLFGRLGRRRGWMALAQVLVGLGLLGMALSGARSSPTVLAAFALMTAFSSSTQDIIVDAWRIEAASSSDELGLLSSAYQLGYRAALLATDALILIAAGHLGWPTSYGLCAAAMAVGLIATFQAMEPAQNDEEQGQHASALPLWTPRGLADAIIGPFTTFFRTHGWLALLMLTMISLYRLPDFVMGPMANPFYHDLGLSKDQVGGVRGTVGLVFSLIGIAAGGMSMLRFGYFRTLIVGAALQAAAVASYSAMAVAGPDLWVFAGIMAVDSFAISFAGVALVTYMSSLASLGYTATQYALLSSTYAYVGKSLKGFSGLFVDSLAQGHSRMVAYAVFFLVAGAIGLPALVLCIFLSRAQARGQPTTPAAAGAE